jgi:hypothetical protein
MPGVIAGISPSIGPSFIGIPIPGWHASDSG